MGRSVSVVVETDEVGRRVGARLRERAHAGRQLPPVLHDVDPERAPLFPQGAETFDAGRSGERPDVNVLQGDPRIRVEDGLEDLLPRREVVR